MPESIAFSDHAKRREKGKKSTPFLAIQVLTAEEDWLFWRNFSRDLG
jgi:hypothetical protein